MTIGNAQITAGNFSELPPKPDHMPTTVAVTGGNGKLGGAVLEELAAAGYYTLDIARGSRRENVADEYRTTDLTIAGEVYGSLASTDVDAIVHAGTIPNPSSHPGHVTFSNNVLSTYYLLEAARALDIESVCLASSINAMSAYWQAYPIEVSYLPVDEAHPDTPRDPYGLAKQVMEFAADGIGRGTGRPRTINSLRYPWLPTDEEAREAFAEPTRTLATVDHESGGGGRDDLFAYLHISDAAQAARRAIEADFDGHERFWVVADDTTMDTPSADLVGVYGDVSDPGFMGNEAHVDTSKAQRILDWTPTRTWRDLKGAVS
jgi:nucleoside-diphosphate-sugar epimerase